MNLLKKLFGRAKQPVPGKQTADVSGRNVMEYAKFLPGYVTAAKAQDRDALTRLFSSWVKCDACGELVHAAKTIRPGGSLVCPSCGSYWVKWGKG